MAISSLTIIGFCGTNITGIFTFNFQPAFIARNCNSKWRKFWQAVSFANLWCDLYCIIKKQKNLKHICDVVSIRVWNHNFKLQIKMVTTFFRVLIFHTSSKSKSHKFTVCLKCLSNCLTKIFVSCFHLTFWLLLELSFLGFLAEMKTMNRHRCIWNTDVYL